MSSPNHEGSGSNSVSLSQGDAPEASEGSATAIPNESAESNGSPEPGIGQPTESIGQPNVVGRKLLPPITPGAAPIFVNEKQYNAILRLRARRARLEASRADTKARRGNGKVKKRRLRGPRGRFVASEGTQEETSAGSQAPSRVLAEDFELPFVATNEDEEHVGEVAYESILNLEAPDYAAFLRIMMGNRYDTEVAVHLKNVAGLEAPHFATIMTVLNNANYDEEQDDGYYDVEKVMNKLAGW
ncbi:hypothetical protein ACP4OV_023039 [Aristida adscensionis]